MSIHERKTKAGPRYDVKLRRPDGSQYQRSFRTKRDAVAFQSAELADMNRGSWIDNRLNGITFAQYAQIWCDSSPTKRSRTLLRDVGIIQKHLNPHLGEIQLRQIRQSDLRRLVAKWSTDGLSPYTIRRQKAVLAAIFRMAVRDELLLRSPADGLALPKAEPSRGRALNREEVRRLLDSVDPQYAPLVFILVTTGLRWSELAGLEIQHFNPLSLHPSLSIEQGLHETPNGIEITPPKSSAAHRVIPLTPSQVAVIAHYLAITGRSGADPHQPLFVSPTGRPLVYTNFRPRIWIPAVKRAGLDGLRIHDLRKTAITNLLQAGLDPKTITVLVGHEDLRTTLQHYAKATPQSLLQASQALVDAIEGTPAVANNVITGRNS